MNIMEQVEAKENPIPLKNEGLGELKCRRHFFIQRLKLIDVGVSL